MDALSNKPVRADSNAPRSEMQITADDEQLLIDLLSAYKFIRRAGKLVALCAVGLLSFIVLLNQAWDAVHGWFTKVPPH